MLIVTKQSLRCDLLCSINWLVSAINDLPKAKPLFAEGKSMICVVLWIFQLPGHCACEGRDLHFKVVPQYIVLQYILYPQVCVGPFVMAFAAHDKEFEASS